MVKNQYVSEEDKENEPGNQPRNRQNSIYTDEEGNEFTKAKTLGSGKEGEVREFRSSTSPITLAIKKPHTPSKSPSVAGSDSDLDSKSEDNETPLESAERQVSIWNKFYPDNKAKLMVLNKDTGDFRVIMPMFEGETLKEMRLTLKTSDNDVVLLLWLDISKNLQKLHELNIAHKDINKDNILLTEDSGTKLIDFSHAMQTQNPSDFREDIENFASLIRLFSPQVYRIPSLRRLIDSIEDDDLPQDKFPNMKTFADLIEGLVKKNLNNVNAETDPHSSSFFKPIGQQAPVFTDDRAPNPQNKIKPPN